MGMECQKIESFPAFYLSLPWDRGIALQPSAGSKKTLRKKESLYTVNGLH